MIILNFVIDDGIALHYYISKEEVLNSKFLGHWIGRGDSCYPLEVLIQFSLTLCRHVKNTVYLNKIYGTEHLEENIHSTVAPVDMNMLSQGLVDVCLSWVCQRSALFATLK
jgi:hypothetical protein